MSVYLHHYPISMFSEKIRLLLGHLDVSWHSVVISPVMPRPLLTPLTGGYRRAPVLQIGANVYCDTNVIARALDREFGDGRLYAGGFNANRVAEWADHSLFRMSISLNFSPAALPAMLQQFAPTPPEDVLADRAKLMAAGSRVNTLSPAAAAQLLHLYLQDFEVGAPAAFLFGEQPCIADFSLYHCLWLIKQNPVNAHLLEPYPNLGAWMQRMATLAENATPSVPSTAEAALQEATENKPVLPNLDACLPQGFRLGDTVDVKPTDYGIVPVTGELVAHSRDEIVIAREDEQAGELFVHFPVLGFELHKVA